MLDAAGALHDLKIPPGNRLEALVGDLAGRHSIRINAQYRVVFRWMDAGPARIGEILAGRRAVTVDTALRLSRYFGTTDGFWTALQTAYDVRRARAELADELARTVPRGAAAA